MRYRVGIVGLSPSRGWAMSAHIPALRALSDDYEITGVANTTLESATAAAQAFGIAHAFASVEAMAEAVLALPVTSSEGSNSNPRRARADL